MKLFPKACWGLLALAVATHGCGGGGSPTAPNTPAGTTGTASATPEPTPTPEPEPTPWQPPGLTACSLGYGSIFGQCGQAASQLLGDVDAAMNTLVEQRPDLFNTADTAGPGSFKVLDREAYFAGLVGVLREAGLCAESEGDITQVKNSNDFSESFDVLLSSDHIRRGAGSYQSTCNPAAFPVDPQQVIHRILVNFFGFQCNDPNRTLPGFNEGLLPVGCVGSVTATPKDIHGNDVDADIHGPDIEWRFHQDIPDTVLLEDFPNIDFNKKLTGLKAGHFGLCATIQGIEGCLDGTVIP